MSTYMHTPALLTAIRGWLEIEQKGHGDGSQVISWDQPAFVAWDKRDGRVCGLLAYNKLNDDAEIQPEAPGIPVLQGREERRTGR